MGRQTIIDFFNELKNLFEINQYPAHSIFNLDETFVSFDQHFKCKVITEIHSKKPSVPIVPTFEHLTAVCCISANGEWPTPLLVLPLKTRPDLSCSSLNLFALAYQSNGWINTNIYENYIQHIFIPFVQNSRILHKCPNQRYLFLVDQHSTRNSELVMKLLFDHNIDYVLLPAHSSTICQPLDLTVFGVFKMLLTKRIQSMACDGKFKELSNTEKRVRLLDAAASCLLTSFGSEHCRAGFEKAGIFPFNPEGPLSSTLLVNNTNIDVVNGNRKVRLDQGLLLPNNIAYPHVNEANLDENELFIGNDNDNGFIYYR